MHGSMKTRYPSTILFATLAVFFLSTDAASAFNTPLSHVPSRSVSTSALWQVKVREEDDLSAVNDNNEAEDQESGWTAWMTRGRKRGVSDVRMRDPEELGGVPRSDRYSAK